MSVTIDKIKELEEKEILKKELEDKIKKLENDLVVKKASIDTKKESLYNDVFNSILTFKSQSAQASEIKDLYDWEKESIPVISSKVEEVYKAFLKSNSLLDFVNSIISKYQIENAVVVSPASLNGSFESKSEGENFVISSGDDFEIDLSFDKIKDILIQKFADKSLTLKLI